MTRFNVPNGAPGATPPAPRASGNAFSALDPNAGGERHPPLPFDSTSVVEIVRTTRAQNTGDCMVTEVKALESDVQSVTPGAKFAIIQPIGDRWGYGIAKFANMVFTAGNCTPEEISEMVQEARAGHGVVNAACGDAEGVAKYGDNPLGGKRIRVYVTRGKESDKGGHFPNYSFSPVE
jgi:hypothetical protein